MQSMPKDTQPISDDMSNSTISCAHTKRPLSWREILLLSVVIPCFCLATLEVLARMVVWVKEPQQSEQKPTALEMPTWMLRDANALTRALPSAQAMEWVNLFTEGKGYRVHLLPNMSKEVKNTFSLIPQDRERGYTITSNSLGFRSPEVSPQKPDNTFRVLVFGDSSSFGWGVDAEESWTTLLQTELQKQHPEKRIEVVNFAIPGDSTAYGRLIFDTFAPIFSSDLTIFGFGANDAKLVTKSHTDQVARFQRNQPLLTVVKALQRSALVSLLTRTLTQTREPNKRTAPERKVPAVSLNNYETNLTYMGSKARELGNQNALFLTLCTPTSYAKKARTAAAEGNFLFFGGQSKLKKLLPQIIAGSAYPEYVARMRREYPQELAQNKLFYITSDGCHPNALGHRFVADQLSTLISDAGVIH
jgi:lysophospholipase L1-like esterase